MPDEIAQDESRCQAHTPSDRMFPLISRVSICVEAGSVSSNRVGCCVGRIARMRRWLTGGRYTGCTELAYLLTPNGLHVKMCLGAVSLLHMSTERQTSSGHPIARLFIA